MSHSYYCSQVGRITRIGDVLGIIKQKRRKNQGSLSEKLFYDPVTCPLNVGYAIPQATALSILLHVLFTGNKSILISHRCISAHVLIFINPFLLWLYNHRKDNDKKSVNAV